MTASKRSLATLTATAALALAAPAAASACADADVQAASLSESQIENSVLCLINERRANSSSGQVRVNGKLRQAALGHSSSMVAGRFFAHTSPDGTSFVDRIQARGYMRGARRWLVGENLVWGSGQRSTPQSLVQSWMDSPPHRANLLRGRFSEIGVGVQRGTPNNSNEHNGVTVSSAYGFRTPNRAGASRKRSRHLKHRRR
jgi:uncharacterized protein YkwD